MLRSVTVTFSSRVCGTGFRLAYRTYELPWRATSTTCRSSPRNPGSGNAENDELRPPTKPGNRLENTVDTVASFVPIELPWTRVVTSAAVGGVIVGASTPAASSNARAKPSGASTASDSQRHLRGGRGGRRRHGLDEVDVEVGEEQLGRLAPVRRRRR